MGRLIEEQAVIGCLTNTAKYYEREDADEWTKGIHYGLLHGLDNILDNVSPVETIPKDQYEARLKADMVAMPEELKKEINPIKECEYQIYGKEHWNFVGKCQDAVQQKINALKAESE